jgi:hypothetical protein
MAITISTTALTFSGGSSFNGTYTGTPITVQTDATSAFASAYNIGTLLFAVNFFYAGNSPTGPSGSPLTYWVLNSNSNSSAQTNPVSASQYYGGSEPYLDPKMVFANGGAGNALVGTWKGRGNPYNKGAQYLLNITMIERVA